MPSSEEESPIRQPDAFALGLARGAVRLAPYQSVWGDLFEREAEVRHGIVPCTWSGEAETLLRRYQWPGNVRELRQAVEVALVRAGGGLVRPKHLPITDEEPGPSGRWDEAQREFRRKFLRAALERNGGNRSATARELGISRQALLYHIRNLDLSRGEDR